MEENIAAIEPEQKNRKTFQLPTMVRSMSNKEVELWNWGTILMNQEVIIRMCPGSDWISEKVFPATRLNWWHQQRKGGEPILSISMSVLVAYANANANAN